jgi:cytochrome c-type biogenesis protein CcmH
MKALLLILFLVLLPLTALAVQPDEVLPDAALEARARAISQNVRCLVCQNQSIDDSDAPLARDLRLLIRERLKAGDSDNQIYDFLTARYGDFVLLRPPVKPATWLLWFGPAVVLVLGAIALVFWFRRRAAAVEQTPISDEERAQLKRLIEDR